MLPLYCSECPVGSSLNQYDWMFSQSNTMIYFCISFSLFSFVNEHFDETVEMVFFSPSILGLRIGLYCDTILFFFLSFLSLSFSFSFVRTSSPSDNSAQFDFIYFIYTIYNGILCMYVNMYVCIFCTIYIFIAIALNESIFLDVLHFPMKNIESRDLEATPMGGATSKPAIGVVCLLLLT